MKNELELDIYDSWLFYPLIKTKSRAFFVGVFVLIIFVLAINFLAALFEGNLVMEGEENIGFLEYPTNWAQTVVFGFVFYMAWRFSDSFKPFFIKYGQLLDFSKYEKNCSG